jgi:hypothetical protein
VAPLFACLPTLARGRTTEVTNPATLPARYNTTWAQVLIAASRGICRSEHWAAFMMQETKFLNLWVEHLLFVLNYHLQSSTVGRRLDTY